jgi:WD40 repeat protein
MAASGKELNQIRDGNAYSCAAFSPDGKRIVSGGFMNPRVRVCDAATGKEVYKYEGYTRDGHGMASFFPDGKRIASSGDGDHTIRIWRAPR